MAAEIRIGKVSKVDYKNGLVSVTYGDLDEAVTDKLPYAAFNSEYRMPQVEEYVLVVHLSNGVEAGVVLGSFWSEANRPEVTGKNVYRKDFSNKKGEAFLQYDPEGGELIIKADHITLQAEGRSVSLASLLSLL